MTEANRPLRVFLCHSSNDKLVVRDLYRRLDAEGWIDVWLDEEKLFPGQDWNFEIEKAVEASQIVLVFLTNNSVTKEGYIQKELRLVLDVALNMPEETIFVIPLKLEDCPVPRRLQTWQWLNYFPESDRDRAYQRLLVSLKMRAGRLGISTVNPSEEQARIEAEKIKQKEAEDKARKEKETRDRKTAEDRARKESEEQTRKDKEARDKKNVEERARKTTEEKARKEKQTRENTERETVAKATQEKSEKLKRDIKIEPVVEKPVATKPGSRKQFFGKLPSWGIGLIAFAFLALIVWTFSLIPPPLDPIQTPSSGSTLTPSATQTPVVKPATKTLVPATSTATIAPTPTFRISTIIGKDGAVLVFVPKGEFTMGSNNGEANEKPVHKITLDAFWIDQTEVTNKQYSICVSGGGCTRPRNTSSDTRSSYYSDSKFDNYPVVHVSWDDAVAYCKWVGRRLPTEAEWEKAARGVDERNYPWGNEAPNTNLLNYDGNIGDTTEVGRYPDGKSLYGAYDMAGNVWEWTNDWYSETYYQNSPLLNPQGPDSGNARVWRGGSWYHYYRNVRSAYRVWSDSAFTSGDIGFRCARSE